MIYKKDYFGYVYLWYDTVRKKFIIGSHHGNVNDRYKTTTGGRHVKNIFKKRPNTMKFKVLQYNQEIDCSKHTKKLEQKWLDLRPNIKNNSKYYNIRQSASGFNSDESSKIQKDRVKRGIHHFLGGEIQKKLVKENKHHFQSEQHKIRAREQNKRLAAIGCHPVQIMVKNGTHHFLGGKIQRETNLKRVKEGKHIFTSKFARKNALKRIQAGNHHFLKSDFNKRPFLLKCSDGREWKYASKVDAVKDGFTAGVIDKLKKQKIFTYQKNTNTKKKIQFKPGDTLYFTDLQSPNKSNKSV
jgi:hypothetical protein